MKVTDKLNRPLLVVLGLLLGALAVALPHCHLDAPIVQLATDDEHFRPPSAPPTYIYGQFESEAPFGLPDSEVLFFRGDGTPLEDLTTQADENGAWEIEVPGTDSYTNVVVYASAGALSLMGIIPEIPRAAQVYDPPREIDLSVSAPVMHPIDDVATTVTLLIEGKLRGQNFTLSFPSASAVLRSMEEIDPLLDEEPVLTFKRMVTILLTEAAAQPTSDIPVFLPPDEIATAGSSLNPAFLTAFEVDYDDDGTRDTTVDAYEAALVEAATAFDVGICYDPDLIRVVFQVDFREGELDGNCSDRDRELWLDGIDPGDEMFIVGGVHEEMVRCDNAPEYEYCATQDDVQITNEALGSWNPNLTPMYDNGTHGDETDGDGVYTNTFDLPRGMRIGYKFTYGPPGALWTGTEEWPGNQRLLELLDVNGDGMVIRHDNWGDEATNKDRSNLLAPARGGRGSVVWDCGDPELACCTADQAPGGVAGCVDANHDGYLDFREIPIDTDRDCVADAWPSPGPVSPLTVECEE